MAAGEDMEVESPAGDIEIVDVEKDAKRFVFIIFTKFLELAFVVRWKDLENWVMLPKDVKVKWQKMSIYSQAFFSRNECKIVGKHVKLIVN